MGNNCGESTLSTLSCSHISDNFVARKALRLLLGIIYVCRQGML